MKNYLFTAMVLCIVITPCKAQIENEQKFINSYDSLGETRLLKAIKGKDPIKVNEVLAKGANPNIAMRDGLKGTPLMYAVAYNNVEIVQSLLDAGAAIDALDINADPAINWATYYGNTKSMRMLIDNGADLTLSSKHGRPVDVAYRLWHADSVALVFRESMTYTISKQEKELLQAARTGDIKLIAKKIGKGANVDLLDELGTPLIHIAAENGDLKMMELLIENGANIEQLNSVGQSVLAISARFGHEQLSNYLLEQGANPNLAGDEYKLTPLIGAVVGKNETIVEMLIEAGADVNTQDVVNKATAAHWALFSGATEICLKILNAGLDYSIEALDGGYTLKEMAEGYKNDVVAERITVLEKLNNPMLGSWGISDIHYIYPDTTYKVKSVYKGRLIVAENSYSIMYNPYGAERKSAENLSKLTDDEIKYAFQTLVFNSGSYKIENGDFITTADMAKVAGFEGGIQYYKMDLKEKVSAITMYDETYPSGDKPEWFGKLKVKFIIVKEND